VSHPRFLYDEGMIRLPATAIFIIVLLSCSDHDLDEPDQVEVQSLKLTVPSALGIVPAATDRPTIAHVKIVDLDQDGLLDVIVCDVLGEQVSWIRQFPSNVFEEQAILSGVSGAVHAEAVDMDLDGDLDVLVAVMGLILPSDAHLGQVIILENDGNQQFTKHVIAEGIQRVTDVQADDLDGDGDLDLAVAQFGYTQGQVQWFENIGDWMFTPHQLIDRSGAIHVPIADIDNDGDPDIIVLLSQEWETVYAFVNDGYGNFSQRILHDVTDADFSSSGISVADLDGDGDQDVIWTNGDAFVTVDYRPLPTHGLQWLENRGDLSFVYHRIGQMDGAYSPTIADMDSDGDLDIVTVAEFAFWDQPNTPSLQWWEQGENGSFTSHMLATSPTHLVTCDVGDLDGNGFPDIVAGGMALYPPFHRVTRVVHWMNDGSTNTITTITVSIPQQVEDALADITSSDAGIRGMILHANGLDAREAYIQALEMDPKNPRWPYYLGIIDVSIGDSASALRHFIRSEQLDPTYAPLLTRLGELYVGQGDIELAKEKLRIAGTDHAMVELAQISASQNNWSEVMQILEGVSIQAAVSLLREATSRLNNEEPQPYIAVDMGYQMDDPWLKDVEEKCVLAPYLVTQAQTDMIGGRIGDAEELLRRAIRIDPSDKDARLALAGILLRPDRANPTTITEAINHLEVGLQIDPSYVMMRAKYGWALLLENRTDEARKVWRSVLEDEPEHAPVLTNIAQLELNQQNFVQAYDYYRLAFSVPEDSPFALSGQPLQRSIVLTRFAIAAKNIGRIAEAIKALELAVDYTPDNGSIQFTLGNLLLGDKKFREALAYLEVASAFDPDNSRILAAIGYTWFNLGELTVAIDYLERSIKLTPNFALGWYHLGNVQLAQGNKLDAIQSFRVAIQLRPDFVLAQEALRKAEGR